MKPAIFLFLLILSFTLGSRAQSQDASPPKQQPPPAHSHQHEPADKKPAMESMPGMQHDDSAAASPTFIDEILHHATPGTSAEPNSTDEPMLMRARGKWRFMFHGAAFVNFEQQSGPRGYDKVFSTSWLMPMVQRELGPGRLTLRTMVSLDPATVTGRWYPELFQQGETAFGKPINDGQHPHDFLMEIAALYDWKLGKHTLLSFYAAPVGDPAMGPAAFEHRVPASENPLAPLGHHLEDSTHIADDVITAGLTYKQVRLEASGFHGREPDEFRWNLDTGAINSWSTRLTVQPRLNWSAQYSLGHFTSPEQLHPEEDVLRMTASVIYNRPLSRGNWAAMLLWGRNHSLAGGANTNGYLAESTLRFVENNRIWTRIENVDRTTDLLLGKQPEPPGFQEQFLARVQAYSFGYDRDFNLVKGLSTAVGGQVTFYAKPDFLTPLYGQHPAGAILFVRIRPTGGGHHH